jgi:hypothetical protein
MAHKANIAFYLYTGFNSTANESYEAFEFLRGTNLKYTHLHYSDVDAYQQVVDAVASWFDSPPEISFPFVTYIEQYDYDQPVDRIQKIVVGVDDIKAIDWDALQAFSG